MERKANGASEDEGPGPAAVPGGSGGEESPIRPNAAIAVDVVLFTVCLAEDTDVADAWQVLLVRSSKRAFEGKRALPGVLVLPGETFEVAARRALRTKAGLDASSWYLEQLGTYGSPDRDSRGRVVSVAH